MKCELCERRDAQGLVTMIVGSKKSVRHVCMLCAKRLQGGDAFAAQMAVLSTMTPPEQEISCPVCGRSTEALRRTGRVGCAACYQAFSPALLPLMTRLNAAVQHQVTQQQPAENPRAQRIAALRQEMFAAVNAEEYERAAELRDALRALEQEGGEQVE